MNTTVTLRSPELQFLAGPYNPQQVGSSGPRATKTQVRQLIDALGGTALVACYGGQFCVVSVKLSAAEGNEACCARTPSS